MTMVVDGAAVAAILKSPQGPVARWMIERATVFQAAARNQQPRKSGCLQDSTVKRFEIGPGGNVQVRLISDTSPCSPTQTSYSLYVHEGTQPHWILPVNGDVLSFFWANGPDGPGQYSFTQVYHPGTAPNRFFTDNLHLFM